MKLYKSKLTPEGVIRHELYEVYRSMLSRCLDPRDPCYRYYGGRGIRVSRRWLRPKGRGFINFLKDMGGGRPSSERSPGGMSVWGLERQNNDKGYYPRNVKWARPSEQNRNKRKRQEKD
jgi:hypothetical protein